MDWLAVGEAMSQPYDGMRLNTAFEPRRLAATLVWVIFSCGVVLSPLANFLSVRASHGGATGDVSRFSLLVRGGMIVSLMSAMLLSTKGRASNWGLALLALAAIASTAVVYGVDGMSVREFAEQSILVVKVFSFFVYFSALSGLSDRRLAKLELLIMVALLSYAVAIVSGAALSIEMFRSYQADTQIRSGYKGIVYAQNEASALVIVSLAFGYLRVLRFGWRMVDTLFVVSMLIAAMLTGTKGAAVGALGVTCAYFYARHNLVVATLRAGATVALLIGAALIAYLAIPQVYEAAELSLRYFAYQSGRISGDKLLTMLLSGRNLKFAAVWEGLAQHNYVELLTGGYPVTRYMVEIDLPDLVLTFGLPIFALYFMALHKAFVYRTQSRPTIRFGKLFFLVLVAVASTAGHVLGSAVVGPYLAFIAVLVGRCAETREAPVLWSKSHD